MYSPLSHCSMIQSLGRKERCATRYTWRYGAYAREEGVEHVVTTPAMSAALETLIHS